MIIVYKCGIVALKRSSDLRDPGPCRVEFLHFTSRGSSPGLRQGLLRGDGGGGRPDGLQGDCVGVNLNPNVEPVQGTLERWLC